MIGTPNRSIYKETSDKDAFYHRYSTFTIYPDSTSMENIRKDSWEEGIIIGGRKINNLRYANDTTLIAKDKQEMSELIKKVEEESLNFALKLNRQKAKLMEIRNP